MRKKKVYLGKRHVDERYVDSYPQFLRKWKTTQIHRSILLQSIKIMVNGTYGFRSVQSISDGRYKVLHNLRKQILDDYRIGNIRGKVDLTDDPIEVILNHV